MSRQPPPPQLCHCCHLNLERAINTHINLELYTSYVYQSMSSFFDRDDVALRHLAQFFQRLSSKERAHTENLIQLLSQRGVCINLPEIQVCEHWDSLPKAMDYALRLQKHVNQSLTNLCKLAAAMNETQMHEFLQNHALHDLARSNQASGDYHHTNPSHVMTPEDELAEFFQKFTVRD